MKRKFLVIFGTVAAAFSAQNVSATVITDPNSSVQIAALNISSRGSNDSQASSNNSLSDDLEFVLKKSDEAELIMAGHRSHSSHSSHRSHYSSR